MKRYIGFVSLEREYEEGIASELKTFFSDDKEEILKWQESYAEKIRRNKEKNPFGEEPNLKTGLMTNCKEANELFRPYYDYLALPLELRQRPGSDAKNEIERLRHDLS